MQLILSTSNMMSAGQSIVRRPKFSKSNVELINSLRSNFNSFNPRPQAPSTAPSAPRTPPPEYSSWTQTSGDNIYIPIWRPTPLSEPRDSYDVTVKLFFLPGIPSTRRCRHTTDAINLVLQELGIESIDLLIVSFPGVSFDADDDGEEEEEEETAASVAEDASVDSDESQGLDAQVKTWRVLEGLHEKGTIAQLGVAEFSSERLAKFLPEVKVRPTVDQINVKDCCVVPKSLIMYAKENEIELLTHNDCTDILPPGTTRELLSGAGVLAANAEAGDAEPGLKGDIEPQWVIKYTAVVKNRGVIENKGYFALAQLGTCIEERPVA